MPDLVHQPFCPFSRFARLALAEHGVEPRLIEERPWERRESFLKLNPAGTLPVLCDDDGTVVPGAAVLAEYLDETRGQARGEHRLLPPPPQDRVETRRVMGWFFDKFHAEVAGPLITEKIAKRLTPSAFGGGSPDTTVIRAAKANIRYHLHYVGWLLRNRNWLAGERMSFADLAAAAQLSSIDYLGDVPWQENEAAKQWYAKIKSRPSFRAILADSLPGMPAAPSYADLDF